MKYRLASAYLLNTRHPAPSCPGFSKATVRYSSWKSYVQYFGGSLFYRFLEYNEKSCAGLQAHF